MNNNVEDGWLSSKRGLDFYNSKLDEAAME